MFRLDLCPKHEIDPEELKVVEATPSALLGASTTLTAISVRPGDSIAVAIYKKEEIMILKKLDGGER